jgi:hypothetical protein
MQDLQVAFEQEYGDCQRTLTEIKRTINQLTNRLIMEQEKLNFNIRLAIRHSLRVLYARKKMQDFFPLTTLSEYENLSDEQIEHIVKN